MRCPTPPRNEAQSGGLVTSEGHKSTASSREWADEGMTTIETMLGEEVVVEVEVEVEVEGAEEVVVVVVEAGAAAVEAVNFDLFPFAHTHSHTYIQCIAGEPSR